MNKAEVNSAKKHKRSRFRYLIESKLQLSVIFYFLAVFAFFVLAFYFCLQISMEKLFVELARVYPKESSTLGPALDQIKNTILSNLLIYAAFGALYYFLGGLILSHRIAGPIYRIKVMLRQYLAGEEIRPAEVRKGDYLQDVFSLLREAFKKMGVLK